MVSLRPKSYTPKLFGNCSLMCPVWQELLLLVLSAFVYKYGPILVILEDLHLFDATSLNLVAEAVRELPHSFLLVASGRPNAGIFQTPSTTQVPLRLACPGCSKNVAYAAWPISKRMFATLSSDPFN